MSEFGDNQVPHQCVGKGQQGIKGIKPLLPLRFRQNFPSLRLGEKLAQYLNGRRRSSADRAGLELVLPPSEKYEAVVVQ